MKAFDKNNIACLVVRLFVLRTWTLALLFLAIAYPSEAQVTSVIQGHISDSTGASVPKALVKVTNERTGGLGLRFQPKMGITGFLIFWLAPIRFAWNCQASRLSKRAALKSAPSRPPT
jgi:hypothetical protein